MNHSAPVHLNQNTGKSNSIKCAVANQTPLSNITQKQSCINLQRVTCITPAITVSKQELLV